MSAQNSGSGECLVSVIIPVYNAAPYLRECLDSVAGQTLRELEIICVDDGSSDESPAILRSYAEQDSRFRLIFQANSGAGAARNRGLREARGRYLSFLDADDFFEPDMLAIAVSRCEQLQADFVVFRSDIYNNDTGLLEPCLWTVKDNLLPARDVFCWRDMERDVFKAFVGWAWDKLYRREFVMAAGLLFQEQRTTNDMFFVFTALVKADRINVCQDVLAHHRRSVAETLSVTREKSWNCFYQALAALRAELQAMGIYEDIRASFVNYALHFCLWNLNTITGPTYRLLYDKLRDEYFADLGITSYPGDQFYHRGEYAQYQKIMALTADQYLAEKAAAAGRKQPADAPPDLMPRRSPLRRLLDASRAYGLRNALGAAWRSAINRIRRIMK